MRVFALCAAVLMCLVGFMPDALAAKASKNKNISKEKAVQHTCLRGKTSQIGFYVPCTRPGMVERYDLAGMHGNKPWLKESPTKKEIEALKQMSEPTGVVPRLPAKQ